MENVFEILGYVMGTMTVETGQMNRIAEEALLLPEPPLLVSYAIEENLLVQMEIVFEVPINVMGTMTVETGQMNKIVEVRYGNFIYYQCLKTTFSSIFESSCFKDLYFQLVLEMKS